MRLIDADALELRCEFGYDNHGILCVPLRDVNESIKKAKTVDAAPIVRCEDCLFWKSGKNECESWEWCKILNTDMPPNGFCHLGDRKDEARNEL